MSINNRAGFSLVEGILLILIMCAVGLIGYYAWDKINTEKTDNISSFEDCKALGNPIRETSPEQCSANGKIFTSGDKFSYTPASSIKQGVKGTLKMRSGDCMPSIGKAKGSCSIATYTTPSKVLFKKSASNENKENKILVKQIDVEKGVFETELQPGLYNMYVLYNGQEYCNSFGEFKGEDCEFTVNKNEVTYYTLQINTATD